MSTLRFCGALLAQSSQRSLQLRSLCIKGQNLIFVSQANKVKHEPSFAYNIIRTHKNFGHNPPKQSRHTSLYMIFLVTGLVATNLDWKW